MQQIRTEFVLDKLLKKLAAKKTLNTDKKLHEEMEKKEEAEKRHMEQKRSEILKSQDESIPVKLKLKEKEKCARQRAVWDGVRMKLSIYYNKRKEEVQKRWGKGIQFQNVNLALAAEKDYLNWRGGQKILLSRLQS